MNGKTLIKVRGAISLGILVLFVLLVVTGVMLYLGTGKGARLHTIAGFLMSILVVVHLGLNYRMLAVEVRALIGK